jgi:hypothetical protein
MMPAAQMMPHESLLVRLKPILEQAGLRTYNQYLTAAGSKPSELTGCFHRELLQQNQVHLLVPLLSQPWTADFSYQP